MATTHTRTTVVGAAVLAGAAATAQRSRQMLIVLAQALAAMLLALSAPVVHAAPEDGQDTENSPNIPPAQTSLAQPLEIHASENPVVFLPWQTTKTITLTWTRNPIRAWW